MKTYSVALAIGLFALGHPIAMAQTGLQDMFFASGNASYSGEQS